MGTIPHGSFFTLLLSTLSGSLSNNDLKMFILVSTFKTQNLLLHMLYGLFIIYVLLYMYYVLCIMYYYILNNKSYFYMT
jgi:hypothetical protein